MASIAKYGKQWRAQIARRGVRKSKVFPSRQEAKDWAAREEYKITNSRAVASAMSLSDLFDRYAREVSPSKRGHRWEIVRLDKIAREIGHLRLGSIEAKDIAAWRDDRLQSVAPGSVRREMGLLGAVFRQARDEWNLMRDNPMTGIRKPSEPPPRDRLPTSAEIERMAHVAGDDLSTATGRAFHAFRFACETAMRAGEIVGLEWKDIDLDRRVAHLAMTKNGHARDVPMTLAAVDLLRMLPDGDPVFGLTSRQLDALFRSIKAKAHVSGLTFHDSRAYALTNLAPRVDILTLAKISGHRDLRILSNTYYRETAEDIAKRLG